MILYPHYHSLRLLMHSQLTAGMAKLRLIYRIDNDCSWWTQAQRSSLAKDVMDRPLHKLET